jgi:hypothetical protein
VTAAATAPPSSSTSAAGATQEGGWLRNSKLAYACFGLFALFLVAQSLTGWRAYDADQREHHEPTVGYASYLTTGHFVEASSKPMGERPSVWASS